MRYSSFFEHHTSFVPGVLENFVRLVHHNHIKVKTRSWYLFYRFAKHLRSQIGNVAPTVIEAVSDLLPIKAELPQEGSEEENMSSDENDQSADATFSSQLYLYEAIGCICSTSAVPLDRQVFYVRSILNPLFADLETHLEPARNGDERAKLQIHHIIMALGTLARGFSDWSPGNFSSSSSAPANEISEEFARAAEAILVALESLNSSSDVRTAARFTFSRLIGVLGARILAQLPRWIDGLLSQSSTKDEMAMFLRLLDQVVYGFKSEIFQILDTLLTPFLQRVFVGISEPTSGTDDEIQLAELKRELLNFLLVILNNDLASVLVSTREYYPDTLILSFGLTSRSKPANLRERNIPHRDVRQRHHRFPHRQTRLLRPRPHVRRMGRARRRPANPDLFLTRLNRLSSTRSAGLRPFHADSFLAPLLGPPDNTWLQPERRSSQTGPRGSGQSAEDNLLQTGARIHQLVAGRRVTWHGHGRRHRARVSAGFGHLGPQGLQAVLPGPSYIAILDKI